jgi:hypothetical protein
MAARHRDHPHPRLERIGARRGLHVQRDQQHDRKACDRHQQVAG